MWAKLFTRKSTTNTCPRSIHDHQIKPLKPEDFDDIFGGPPRCVFSRHSSVANEPSDYDMFHNPLRHETSGPDLVRRSKLDTTSVLNSEYEFSPLTSDDDFYSASKPLRPTIDQPTWNSSTLMHGVQQGHQDIPQFPYSRPSSYVEKQFLENFGSAASRRDSSPESMTRSAYSYSSVKVSVGDQDDYTNKFYGDDDDDDDDDDYQVNHFNVFEFNYSYCREGTDEGVGVDEAIAWAKESYKSHSTSAQVTDMSDKRMDGSESLHLQGEYPNKKKTEKDQREMDESREMKMLEEGIKLWSCGKERNIELLLSTLEDILWPNSGWCPIPPTNLYECSNVKKAYQRARLRLHPDKLQQRGATVSQKYIAERIFLILQEAWDAYISQDIIISSRG